MDWIEKLIGVSPDAGDGSAEAAIVFACAIVLGGIVAMRVPAIRERIRAMLAGWRMR